MVGKVHYMHFGLLCWWVTVLMAYSVSLVTKPIPAERVSVLAIADRSLRRTLMMIYMKYSSFGIMTGV